jgi:hypothetical protein
MKLRVTGDGVFWLESAYDERATPKAARFHWHPTKDCPRTCVACAAKLGKVWWTKTATVAAALAEFADADARKALGRGAPVSDTDLKAKIPDWPETLRYADRACELVLRSPAPEMLWLATAGALVAQAAAKTNDPAARARGLRWVVLADEVANDKVGQDSAAARRALRQLDWDGASELLSAFHRACGTAQPIERTREPLGKALGIAARLPAGRYHDGFYRLFTEDLAALDPLVRDRSRDDGQVWVIGRNAYGMLWITGPYNGWFGELVVVARPDEPQPTEPASRDAEAFGVRVPNRSLGRFSDAGPYDAWVRANGPLPADHVLQQQGDQLVAVPAATYYAAWPVPKAPPPKPEKKPKKRAARA